MENMKIKEEIYHQTSIKNHWQSLEKTKNVYPSFLSWLEN